MRILMTGATGLIGSAIQKHLSEFHDIITLGRGDDAVFKIDLTDADAIGALDLPTCDALVHCAGVIDEDFRDAPELAVKMAIFGADALVCRAIAAGVRRIVYISSAHVYGPMLGHVDEARPVNPQSDYAIAHYATEQVFRRHARDGVSGLALRPCAVFGILQKPSGFRRWSLIPFSFPRDAIIQHHIRIRSTGEQRRNFVGTQDIATCCSDWLAATEAIDQPVWTGLNPIGAMSCSVYDFARLCAEVSQEISGIPCTITRQEPTEPTPGADFDYSTLSSLARGGQPLRATLAQLMHTLRES